MQARCTFIGRICNSGFGAALLTTAKCISYSRSRCNFFVSVSHNTRGLCFNWFWEAYSLPVNGNVGRSCFVKNVVAKENYVGKIGRVRTQG